MQISIPIWLSGATVQSRVAARLHLILAGDLHLYTDAECGYRPMHDSVKPVSGFGRYAAASHVIEVTWQPTWEPRAVLDEEASVLPFVQGRSRAEVAAASCITMDAELTPRQQQGLGRSPLLACILPHGQLRKVIHIEPFVCNPDTDVQPTFTYHIALHAQPDCMLVLGWVIDPTGAAVGTITMSCLEHLYSRFSLRNVDLTPPQFAMLPAQLLHRNGIRHGGRRTDDRILSNHWSLPYQLMTVLHTHLGVTIERFASALNVHTGTQQYYSAAEGDAVFGASLDAYYVPWLRASECNPGFEVAHMDKALRWTISSCISAPHTPSMTVFALPDWSEAGIAYMRWLRHSTAHCSITHICTFAKDQLSFRRPRTRARDKSVCWAPSLGSLL